MKKKLAISKYQEQFFLEWLIDPDSCNYNESIVFKIIGEFDKSKFKRSCEIFIQEHEIIHAKYSNDGSQCFHGNYGINDFYHEIELNELQNLESFITTIISKSFDLTKDPLWRFYLITTKSYFCFIINAHHILLDAVCATMATREIAENYNLLLSGKKNHEDKAKVFFDAIIKEEQELKLKNVKKASEYWRNKLLDLPLTVDFYKDLLTLNEKKLTTIYFSLTKYELDELYFLIKESKSTLFIVLAALYGFLVAKYGNQNKLVLSYPINMRPHTFSHIIGCFVNNLPLVIDLDSEKNLQELIANIKQQRLDAKEQQWYHMYNIVQDQREVRHEPNSQYFNVGFVEGFLNSHAIHLTNTYVNALDVGANKTGVYDLNLTFDARGGDGLKFRLEVKSEVFNEEIANNLVQTLKNLIKTCKQIREQPLNEIAWLNTKEYNTLIYDWNNTEKVYPQNKTIVQLFEEQVEQTPNNIALVYAKQELTYQDLNEKSNQLAKFIRQEYKSINNSELAADTLIPLCLDKSLEMIIGMLAILKAGGAYVPVSPNYPHKKIAMFLHDIQSRLLLTNERCNNLLQNLVITEKLPTKIYVLDDDLFQLNAQKFTAHNLTYIVTTSNDLAYVIYTSGTTGKPNGVMVEHRNVINFIYAVPFTRIKKLNAVLIADYIFDASIFGIWSNLLFGHKLFIVTNVLLKDVIGFKDFLIENNINKLYLPAAMLKIHAKSLLETNCSELLTGVEPIRYADVNPLITKGIHIINGYGPTETTVCSHFYIVKEQNQEDLIIPLGFPIANTKAYILDINLQPVPIGVIGELYIGGDGVARGYLNKKTLTHERFLLNPFQSIEEKKHNKNTRIYKTGDLVCYLPNGNLKYIGRNDFQVKIRGFRIELGEIEQNLRMVPEVLDAVVIVRKHEAIEKNYNSQKPNDYGANKYLVAYYTATKKLEEKMLLECLTAHLPTYMIPNIFVWLPEIPLTMTGKLDRNALPRVELNGNTNYAAPVDMLEFKLCEFFAEILHLPVTIIGRYDDFFFRGGNSILAITLITKINTISSCHISVADVMKLKRIDKIAEHCKINALDSYPSVDSCPTKLLLKTLAFSKHNAKSIFFIHPAGAGCEVYQNLADKLYSRYNSFGINNYNIVFTNQITSLNLLAREYIKVIKSYLNKKQQINLCGWSLGGQIALEMAYILEQEGFTNVSVILLDTKLSYENKNIEEHIETDDFLPQMLKIHSSLLNGKNDEYKQHLAKVKLALKSEIQISKDNISGNLLHTRVLSFRAMYGNNFIIADDSMKFSWCSNLSELAIDASHFDIISKLVDDLDAWQTLENFVN